MRNNEVDYDSSDSTEDTGRGHLDVAEEGHSDVIFFKRRDPDVKKIRFLTHT